MQYQLSDNQTDVQVEWYRSRDEQTAGIEIENLTHTHISIHSSGNFNSTTFIQYRLDIKNFSDSDRGYYWCQMVVNNTALPPSPYGYINSSKCTLTEATCYVMNEPLCAQNLTLHHMAVTEQNGLTCKIEAITYNEITTSMITRTKANIIKPNDSSTRCDFSQDGYPCAAGVITAAVVTTGILLLVSFCLLVFIIKSRKKQLGKLIMHYLYWSTFHIQPTMQTIIMKITVRFKKSQILTTLKSQQLLSKMNVVIQNVEWTPMLATI